MNITDLGLNVMMDEEITISEQTVLPHNILLGEGVRISRGAVIGANAVIGYSEKVNGQSRTVPTEIGENTVIRSGTVIYCGTRIGTNSKVGHNCVLRENTLIGHDAYIGTLSCIEGDTTIGNYVGIQSHGYITKYCVIDDYTFIAPQFVGANDAAMSHRRATHGENLIGFTTEKYVRIAVGVVALPGVHFGEGCIVGAGSVVTKDVPRYAVVMGIPARVVRPAPRDEVVNAAGIPIKKEELCIKEAV